MNSGMNVSVGNFLQQKNWQRKLPHYNLLTFRFLHVLVKEQQVGIKMAAIG